jgi:hypothetical protein
MLFAYQKQFYIQWRTKPEPIYLVCDCKRLFCEHLLLLVREEDGLGAVDACSWTTHFFETWLFFQSTVDMEW